MMNVYLWNPKEGKGKNFVIPAEFHKIYSAEQKWGESTPIVIREVKSSLKTMDQYIRNSMITIRKGMEELEFLDKRLGYMTEEEKSKFCGILEIEQPSSLMEVVNLSCNLGQFTFYKGITNETQLGEYLMREAPDEEKTEEIWKSFGELYAKQQKGVFTPDGYVERAGESIQNIYFGKELPPSGAYDSGTVYLAVFTGSMIENGFPKVMDISLPTTEKRIQQTAQDLGRNTIEACRLMTIWCPSTIMEKYMPLTRDVKKLNEYAKVLSDQDVLHSELLKRTLAAALEGEMPERIEEAIEIAKHLDQYVLLSDQGLKEDTGLSLDQRQTSLGLILKKNGNFQPEAEEIVTVKLFGRLNIRCYQDCDERGYFDSPVQISGTEACHYEEKIREAIREFDRKAPKRGLAEYLDNQLLATKIVSMRPSVEKRDGTLWGVLEIKSKGELSEEELAEGMKQWDTQKGDGWGEGFSTCSILVNRGVLHVSYTQGTEFIVKTTESLRKDMTDVMQMGGI